MSDVGSYVKAFDSESAPLDWSSVKRADLRADDEEFLTPCLSFFNDVSDGFQKHIREQTRTDSRSRAKIPHYSIQCVYILFILTSCS